MGPFTYKSKNYFVERFDEDCECVQYRGGGIQRIKKPDPQCKMCMGDGTVAYIRWFKEIRGDPRK